MIHKGAQKYIFVKKQYFYNRLICKKAAFLHKKATFLQKYIFTTVQFVKKQLFYIKMTLFYKDRFFMQHIYIYIRLSTFEQKSCFIVNLGL